MIDIDQRQIAYIEGGNSMPSLKTLCKLISIFNCQMYELFIIKPNIEDKKQLIEEIQNSIKQNNINDLMLINEILKCMNTFKNYLFIL